MNRLSEGYKRAVEKNWSCRAKIVVFGQKTIFQAQKRPLLYSNHVLAATRKSFTDKKGPFSKISISLLASFGCCFGKKKHFSAKRKNGLDQACSSETEFFIRVDRIGKLQPRAEWQKLWRMFEPKMAIYAPKYVFFGTYRPYRLIWCPDGWWLCRAGCISQDTYLLYIHSFLSNLILCPISIQKVIF